MTCPCVNLYLMESYDSIKSSSPVMLVDRTVATPPALVAQAPSDRPLEKALTTWRGERKGPIFATYKPLTQSFMLEHVW